MALTKAQAKAIVDVVAADPTCKARIRSWLRHPLPDSWGVAGSVRNFGYALATTYKLAKEDAFDNNVCTGIADATSKAINAAKPAGVERASNVDRMSPIAHTATEVVMKDGSHYVFDWHHTLNPVNPILYRSPAAWIGECGAVPYVSFMGW